MFSTLASLNSHFFLLMPWNHAFFSDCFSCWNYCCTCYIQSGGFSNAPCAGPSADVQRACNFSLECSDSSCMYFSACNYIYIYISRTRKVTNALQCDLKLYGPWYYLQKYESMITPVKVGLHKNNWEPTHTNKWLGVLHPQTVDVYELSACMHLNCCIRVSLAWEGQGPTAFS